MLYIFHGDDQASSRNNLLSQIAVEKNQGRSIMTFDGAKITPQDLDSTLATANLFGEESIVIENIASRPLSGDRKKLFGLIKTYTGNKNILIWDKKEITKANITALSPVSPKPTIVASKTPAIIFTFLDSLAPGSASRSLHLMHQAASQVEDGFIFVMTCRQIADLIVAKSGDTSKLIPFKRTRLISQATLFPDFTLYTLHSSLLSIDRAIKTGQTKMSYLEHLDLLLVSLLN